MYIQATDNVGIGKIQCPTSTASGSYNNWAWFNASWDNNANAYRCDITPSSFGHYGQTYKTHLYIYDTVGNGGYYNETSIVIPETCSYNSGKTWDFAYKGSVQSFTVPCSGTYKLEVWGAQGGNTNQGGIGGYGGYSQGTISLSKNSILYTVVGSAGANAGTSQYATEMTNGGYNGGGSAVGSSYYTSGSGGGATNIGTRNGTLAQYGNTSGLYIVAGGGGGARLNASGGTGGGTGGGAGGTGTAANSGIGGTQSSAGTAGGFGYGDGISYNPDKGGAGGGGGYYGGAGGWDLSGGGGSGYIGGVTNGSMKNGIRSGNGYARITLVSTG